MISAKPWVIFDADNTLWNLEILYDGARTAFCQYLIDEIAEQGQQITPDLLDQAQRQRDIQLKRTHGYSASRFARSFEDTATFFFPFITTDQIIHVRKLALDVLESPAKPVDDLEYVLEALRNEYNLAIITAGERWVQERRLSEFHFRDKFVKMLVVERKTAGVLLKFCHENGIKKEGCWVVGDSIQSDIQPAITAGLKAIHVNTRNWEAEAGILPMEAVSVSRIREILPLLLSGQPKSDR
jgi:putative hydrolase of the HAD superfamily